MRLGGERTGVRMHIYDVTRTLVSGMPTWPGEAGPELTPIKRMAAGDPASDRQPEIWLER